MDKFLDIPFGPGFWKCNTSILDDPIFKADFHLIWDKNNLAHPKNIEWTEDWKCISGTHHKSLQKKSNRKKTRRKIIIQDIKILKQMEGETLLMLMPSPQPRTSLPKLSWNLQYTTNHNMCTRTPQPRMASPAQLAYTSWAWMNPWSNMVMRLRNRSAANKE